ncbi:MAG: tetratricopeptide repeat protein [Fibrobacter sp.]|nr:tetratricopeptide repeat protein [Fibrobacter sp.]
MRCSDFLKNLHQFANNALSDELREDALAHLNKCRNCSDELNSLKTLLQCLAQMPVPEKDDSYWQNMNLRICSEIKQISRVKDSNKSILSFPRSSFGKWAIAALFLISVVSVSSYFSDKLFSKQNTSSTQEISFLKIVDIQGQVFGDLSSDSDPENPIDIKSTTLEGKTIRTAESSSLRLQTDDKSFLDVAEKTSLLIKECNQKKQSFALKHGTVTAQVNKRNAGQTYQITTANASCEVVGTRFNLSFKENPDPRESQTILHVLEGRVLFINASGFSVIVDSGYQAVASHDTIIMPHLKRTVKKSEKDRNQNDFKDHATKITSKDTVPKDDALKAASALMESGSLDEAIKELRKIHSTQDLPKNIRINALQKEARCWKMKKNYSQAIKTLQQILNQADSDNQKEYALFQIASLQRNEIHDFDSAILNLKRYLSDFPQGIWTEEACITLAELYQLQKNYPNASELYQKFISQYPKSIRLESVLYSLARIYSRDMQDCNKALNIYSQIESQFPKSNFAEDALFWKAECLFQLKRISQSVSAYKQYLTRYPDGKWVTEAQIRSGYKITAGTAQ